MEVLAGLLRYGATAAAFICAGVLVYLFAKPDVIDGKDIERFRQFEAMVENRSREAEREA